MKKEEFIDKLYDILDCTKQLERATLAVETHCGITFLLIELKSGEKFCIEVHEIDFKI